MGRMSVNAGGGGADLDAITAGAEDIVSPKVGLDNEGEPLAGTLKDNSGVTKSAAASLDATNSRVQLTVPETGKYSLTSKLYATYATIRSLIGLTADKLWTGVTILGLKSSRNALAAKTWTPGTANQTIAAGTCVTGAQTIKGDSNLKAANIKKGVSIFGITGTWEGYVAAATDLYKQGVNNAGFKNSNASLLDSAYCTFETTYIDIYPGTTANNDISLLSNKSYNFAGYDYLKVQIYYASVTSSNADHKKILLQKSDGTDIGSVVLGNGTAGSTKTISISLANFQTTFIPELVFTTRGEKWQIQRIWIE